MTFDLDTHERRRELGDLLLAYERGARINAKFATLRTLGYVTFGGEVTDHGRVLLVEAYERRVREVERHVSELIRCGRNLVKKNSKPDDVRYWSKAAAEAKKAVPQ